MHTTDAQRGAFVDQVGYQVGVQLPIWYTPEVTS